MEDSQTEIAEKISTWVVVSNSDQWWKLTEKLVPSRNYSSKKRTQKLTYLEWLWFRRQCGISHIRFCCYPVSFCFVFLFCLWVFFWWFLITIFSMLSYHFQQHVFGKDVFSIGTIWCRHASCRLAFVIQQVFITSDFRANFCRDCLLSKELKPQKTYIKPVAWQTR